MVEIYDFAKVPYSSKHGKYGGAAGDKDGVLIDNEFWLIKYPKNIRALERTGGASYSTTPLSEFIGSHIYQILGFPVHETRLGIRDNKVVVACKDFAVNGELAEIRTIKNTASDKLYDYFKRDIGTGDKHKVDIDVLLKSFEIIPLLSGKSIQERFWDQVIVDIYIGNNDRNNGNWGMLSTNSYKILAPVFDNGGSFQTKISEDKIIKILSDKQTAIKNARDVQTAYERNGHSLNAVKVLNLLDEFPMFKERFELLCNKIYEKHNEIKDFINSIPTIKPINGTSYDVCSENRKTLMCLQLDTRLQMFMEYQLKISIM